MLSVPSCPRSWLRVPTGSRVNHTATPRPSTTVDIHRLLLARRSHAYWGQKRSRLGQRRSRFSSVCSESAEVAEPNAQRGGGRTGGGRAETDQLDLALASVPAVG